MPDSAAAKILVADDDQSLVRTLMWILKENGYEVVVAPGGEGLMGKLEEERPHLLLLDIMMPKVDGLQLLAKMKADERLRDLPVLMISSMPPRAAWGLGRRASSWGSWWPRTRIRCCATCRSSWPATPRSSARSQAAARYWWRRSPPTRCTPRSARAGSASASPSRRAPRSRCPSP